MTLSSSPKVPFKVLNISHQMMRATMSPFGISNPGIFFAHFPRSTKGRLPDRKNRCSGQP